MTRSFRIFLPILLSATFIIFLATHNPVKADLFVDTEGTFMPAYTPDYTYGESYESTTWRMGPDGTIYFLVNDLDGNNFVQRFSHDGQTLLNTSAVINTTQDFISMTVDSNGKVFVAYEVGDYTNAVNTVLRLGADLTPEDSYVLTLDELGGYHDQVERITEQGDYLYVMTMYDQVLKVNKDFSTQSFVLHETDSIDNGLFDDETLSEIIATPGGELYFLNNSNLNNNATFFKCVATNCLATYTTFGTEGSDRGSATLDNNGYFYVAAQGFIYVYTPTGLLAGTQVILDGGGYYDNGEVNYYNGKIYFRSSANQSITVYDQYTGLEPSTTPVETPTTTDTPPETTPPETPTDTPLPNYSRYTNSFNVPASYNNIGEPHGMAITTDTKIWYVDTLNKRLVEMDPGNDTIIRTVGREGSAEGEFDTGIYSVAIDNEGYLYVLSTTGTLYKLDPNGGYMAKYNLSNGAGGIGSTNGLSDPHGITYDSVSGTLLITNMNGNKVEEFTKDLVYVSTIGTGDPGTGDYDLREPHGITTDADGKIYVVDGWNQRLQVFGADHSYLMTIDQWVDNGTHNFEAIAGVVVLSDGTITITNQNGPHTVEQFTSNGTYIRTFGGAGTSGDLYLDKMTAPNNLVRDASNNIYVSDWGQNTISKFSSSGSFVSSLHNNELNNAGNSIGKLYFPVDVAYNATGYMFVLDGKGGSGSRVEEYTNGGTYVGHAVASGIIGDGAYHIIFGPDGRMYVSSTGNVKVFTGSGLSWTLAATISSWGVSDGFNQARGMTFDSAGNLYVVDMGHQRIVKFNSSLHFANEFGSEDLTSPSAIAINSAGHVIVGDQYQIVEFDENYGYVRHIGAGVVNTPWSLIINNDVLYVTDAHAVRGWLFNALTGEYIDRFGNSGGNMVQFQEPSGLAMNPVSNTLTIADMYNGRVEALNTGFRLLNLIPSANVVIRTHQGSESPALDSHAGQSLSGMSWDPVTYDLTVIPARLYFGAYAVADFTVNMTQDRDWSNVNVLSLPIDSKALVVNLNSSLAPGISGTHSLYITRYNDQHSATVCPDATTLGEVSATCSNVFTLLEGDSQLHSLTVDGKNYWKIDGLTGTGAFSSLFETSMNLKDVMTREKVSTPSDHAIYFGTTNGLSHPGDHFTLTFGSGWVMSAFINGNIGLKSGATTLTVAGSPGVNVWGVSSASNVITLTAPINTGSAQYLDPNSPIEVLIVGGSITNPDTVGSYPIDIMLITSDGGTGFFNETGTINVPIVDSDQVNVTGFINTFIDFDIDTGTIANVECAYNGCQSYAGGVNADNYTVDLGELTSTAVNKSQGASVMHAAGTSGAINSIYFDLITNAYNGAVVTVSSQYGWLQGPDSNTIDSVANGDVITANSGKYGYTLPVPGTGNGTINRNGLCQGTTYCGVSTTAATVFDTAGKPLDYGRLRMDLAAAASYTNNPGAYHDTLTFIATSTF